MGAQGARPPQHPEAPWEGRVGMNPLPFPAPGISLPQDPRLWGRGRFLLPLRGGKVGLTSAKERDGWIWRGICTLRDTGSPGLCPLCFDTDLLSQRRHLWSSLRRGTRSSTAPWATTTISHVLLGNFEVMEPTCQGERWVLRAPGWAGNGRERLSPMGAPVWGWADCPQGPDMQWLFVQPPSASGMAWPADLMC